MILVFEAVETTEFMSSPPKKSVEILVWKKGRRTELATAEMLGGTKVVNVPTASEASKIVKDSTIQIGSKVNKTL